MRRNVAIILMVACCVACGKESSDEKDSGPVIPRDGATLIGSYAADDGSCLTDMFYAFADGNISEYRLSSESKVALAENALWHTSMNDFSLQWTRKYQVSGGCLYVDGVTYGSIGVASDYLLIDNKRYTKIRKFNEGYYTTLSVEKGFTPYCSSSRQTVEIPVSVEKVLPNAALVAKSSADWLAPGTYASGMFSFEAESNWTLEARTAIVTFSYPGAEDLIISVQQQQQEGDSSDLSAFGSSNCYIVPSSGIYKFKAVKGNSNISVGTVASAEVLWESFGTSQKPNVGDVIYSAVYSADYVYFSTPSTLKNGNAIIAVKDADDNILWSWHIWVCNGYNPASTAQVYYNNAGTMMDRNLGASSATPGDVGALGLLYQWGRKDPFLGSSSISSSTQAASTLSWPSAVASNSSNGTIAYAVAHPTTFIKQNTNNYDWYYSGSSTDDTRWQSTKTIYDPCPPGWRVPDGRGNGVWSKACGSSSSFSGYPFDDTNKGMNFSGKFGASGTSGTIWYPAAGCLGNGSLESVGSSGSGWSCTPDSLYADVPDSLYAYGLLYTNGIVNPSCVFGSRAIGLSVRCLQE